MRQQGLSSVQTALHRGKPCSPCLMTSPQALRRSQTITAGKRKAPQQAGQEQAGKLPRLMQNISSLKLPSRLGRQQEPLPPSGQPLRDSALLRGQPRPAGSELLDKAAPARNGSTGADDAAHDGLGAAAEAQVQAEAVGFTSTEEGDALEDIAASGDGEKDGDRRGPLRSNILLMLRRRRRGKREKKEEEELPPMQCSHPALQLLRQRQAEGSLPQRRTDDYKLGLVIEGGGMRGAVSAGGLLELGNLGFRECFDAVYGSSAGAINATYFLSGQREGVHVYTDDISNKQFLDLGRLLPQNRGSGPVMNLEFLLDFVLEFVKPLDWQAVLDSPIPLKVVASSLDRLQSVLLTDFADREDLVTCLKASANVPKIAGDPVVHRGERLVDAAVFEAVPWRAAIADGCTHVVVLCTRPASRQGRVRKAMSGLFEGAVKKAVLSPAYMRPAWQREVAVMVEEGLTADEMLLLSLEEGAEQLPFFAGSHVYPVYPGPGAKYAPVSIDVPTLHRGLVEGRQAVRRMLQPYSRHVEAVFEPVIVPQLSPEQHRRLAVATAQLYAAGARQSFKDFMDLGDGMCSNPEAFSAKR